MLPLPLIKQDNRELLFQSGPLLQYDHPAIFMDEGNPTPGKRPYPTVLHHVATNEPMRQVPINGGVERFKISSRPTRPAHPKALLKIHPEYPRSRRPDTIELRDDQFVPRLHHFQKIEVLPAHSSVHDTRSLLLI